MTSNSNSIFEKMAAQSIYSEVPEINKLLSDKLAALIALGFKTEEITPIPYGSRLILRQGEILIGINLYYSKKKGFSFVPDAKSPSRETALVKDIFIANNSCSTNDLPPEERNLTEWIGSDEAGKGDYLGPLVIAAFRATQSNLPKILAAGVKDSKLLKKESCLDIAQRLLSEFKPNISIVEVSPQTYNRLYPEFHEQGKTLNDLLGWAHQKAIMQLLTPATQAVVVDRFARFPSFHQLRSTNIRLILRPKAESNPAVAAASILARARYLNRLDRLSKTYRVQLKPGAGSDTDDVVRELIARHGSGILENTAKLHFKNTAKVLNDELPE